MSRESEKWVDFFDAHADEYASQTVHCWSPIYDYLGRYVEERSPAAIVDVACGEGSLLRMIASLLSERSLIGVEASSRLLAIAVAKSEGKGSISWIQGNALRLPVRSHTSELVICCLALPFFSDIKLAARELARIAAPGSELIVVSLLTEMAAFFSSADDIADQEFIRQGIVLTHHKRIGRDTEEPSFLARHFRKARG